jgi:23S rRNA (pseudouridine1915-N3)-methyltransferase
MRVRVIWTGKTRNAHLRALCDDYLSRLKHFVRCEVTELRESRDKDRKQGIDKESRRISEALPNSAVTVLLDPEGSQWDSRELAKQIQRWGNDGVKEVAFVIGGPEGVSPELAACANKRWSLTRLTLTHEMARVVLVEQLYRAYTIINGLPYQKG